MNLSQDEFAIFRDFARHFLIAIKNGIFYKKDHPIFIHSIDNLKESLSKWFQNKEVLELGFTHENLYLDGVSLESKDACFGEIAYYLHVRGILSLKIMKGISVKELADFVSLIKFDEKTIKKKGGLFHNIPANSNLQVQEIDYSHLLSRSEMSAPTNEDELWEFLFKNQEFFDEEDLPASKVELLLDFFKDKSKSATLLNKVYKRALKKQADAKMVQAVRGAVYKVCKHLSTYAGDEESRAHNANMMDIISQLHPDFIARLFEMTSFGGKDLSLAEELTKGLSDTFIANFIESLIQNEGSMNENLLRIFDRLDPDDNRMESITPIVADQMFSKKMISPGSMSQMQTSLEELFKSNPESSFANEMYRITVDSVLNQKLDSLVYMAKLQPVISAFVQSIEGDHLHIEKARLLLNILWHENDSDRFEKTSKLCETLFKELIANSEFECVHEIIRFFKTKLSAKEKLNLEIGSRMRESMNRMLTRGTYQQIIANIADADKDQFHHIIEILENGGNQVVPLLVESYTASKNPKQRKYLQTLFKHMQKLVSGELHSRLKSYQPQAITQLYPLFMELDPQAAHAFSREMLMNKNIQIRWQAMNTFQPQSKDDCKLILDIYQNEKDKELQKRAAIALLKTENREIISALFKVTQNKRSRNYFLIPLIELCGSLKTKAAFPALKEIFQKKGLLNQKKIEEEKIAAAHSMIKIHRPEALKMLHLGSKDSSLRVRTICRELLNEQLISEVGDELNPFH